LVVGTTRIATIHRRLTAFHAKCLPLKFVAPPLDIPPVTEAIVWHEYRDQRPGNIWVRRMLKEAASDGSPAGA
jgi:hypothetical protein